MSGQPQFHPGDFRRGLRHAGLTHGEFRVAVELAEYARPGKPTVWPSATTLAEICGMTKRGIQLVLASLEAKRAIVCTGRSKGGRGHTNHWRLLVIPAPETVNDASPFTDPETANHGSPFADEKANHGSPFADEKANENAHKGRTKTHEKANGGSPEVGRSCESEVGARASERTDHPGNHSPEPTHPNGISIEPPKRACTRYPHSEACGTCKSDNDAHRTWLADSRRLLDDLDRERDAPGCPEWRATEISNRRMARIAVFQRIGEPWK